AAGRRCGRRFGTLGCTRFWRLDCLGPAHSRDRRLDFGAEILRKTACNFVRLYEVQMLLSRKAVSWDLESAPTRVASTLPFLNSIRVGMPRMPNLAGTCWFWSTLIFAIFSRPSYSFATSSRIGAIDLHGPH